MATDKLCIYLTMWKPIPKVDFAIEIEPGMAFGTGTHETTQMMLKMMLKHLQGIDACHVLDVGAGSGILSIAADRFGHTVHGIELDPVAVRNAEQNLREIDGCRSHWRSEPTEMSDRERVLVNILAKIILGMADENRHTR